MAAGKERSQAAPSPLLLSLSLSTTVQHGDDLDKLLTDTTTSPAKMIFVQYGLDLFKHLSDDSYTMDSVTVTKTWMMTSVTSPPGLFKPGRPSTRPYVSLLPPSHRAWTERMISNSNAT